MPSDEYSTAGGGGGALRLKGAKVGKKKKSKKNKPSDLERALSTGADGPGSSRDREPSDGARRGARDEMEDEQKAPGSSTRGNEQEEEGGVEEHKTEAERRHEEFKRRQMLKLAESSSGRPELLKTHKERVEELNTYLSKLSEHHDMPKIGPG